MVVVARVLNGRAWVVPPPRPNVFRRRGEIGVAVAILVSLSLALATGLSVAVQGAVAVAGVFIFVIVVIFTKALCGRERIICWHHQLAVLGAVAAVAAGLGAPVLGHLDVSAVGLGAFLLFGRTGCLAVGCCHGRPTTGAAVVYGEEHVRAGLEAYLAGIPLVPWPLLDAGAAASAGTAGAAAVLAGAKPGTGLEIYLAGYALARLALEEWRGDLDRPYWHGRSEAQWTALVVVAALTIGIAVGILPGPALIAPALPATAALVLAIALRSANAGAGLLQPSHVEELKRTLAAGGDGVTRTSRGVRISAGVAGGHKHYALSRQNPALDAGGGRALARVILWLAHPDGDAQLVRGPAAVWHVIVDRARAEQSRRD